jgi:hypothetical protein
MVDEVPFEVEHAGTVGGRPVVLARLLGPAGDLTVNAESTLEGRPLDPYLDVPRTLGPDGRPRLDLFAFRLRHERDLSHFAPGQRVLLRTTRSAPTTHPG